MIRRLPPRRLGKQRTHVPRSTRFGVPITASGGAPAAGDAGWLPILLVLAAVLFNGALAIVNASFMRLTTGSVIGAELVIVMLAQLTILRHYRQEMLPWFGMIAVAVLFSLIRGAVVGHFEPKFLRDVLLIPTFLMLGMTTSPRRLPLLLVLLHIAIVGVAIFEATFTQAYSNLFDVRGYYIATRAFDDTDFWNTSSDLFVSATRPGERFFSFVDLHRVSSTFLEPVSLGNYVVIVTAFLCVAFHSLSPRLRAFLILGNLIALVACDGRHAALCSLVIIAMTVAAPRMPRTSALIYLPIGLIGAVILANVTNANPRDDNFMGRLAHCVTLLGRYDTLDWLGLSNRFLVPASDSGIAYMIETQSFIGVLLFWLLLVVGADERRTEQTKYLHALCLYIVLTMLVSYSLFSIKTAALLWFIHGSLQAGLNLGTSAVTRVQAKRQIGGRRFAFVRGLRPRPA
jgi:putative polymerase